MKIHLLHEGGYNMRAFAKKENAESAFNQINETDRYYADIDVLEIEDLPDDPSLLVDLET